MDFSMFLMKRINGSLSASAFKTCNIITMNAWAHGQQCALWALPYMKMSFEKSLHTPQHDPKTRVPDNSSLLLKSII
jgi:hypothetical protein